MRSEYRACKFNPSGKNLGGRNQIEGQQRNHLLALINTQPTVNTRLAPHAHVDKGRKSKSK